MPYATGSPPSWYPIFCTTDVPASQLNSLVEKEWSDSIKNENVFVLVTKRDEAWTYGLQHHERPISSDLKQFSVEDLGALCRRLFEEPHKNEDDWRVAAYMFGVIDERSLRDDTMMLVQDEDDFAPDYDPVDLEQSPRYERAWMRTRMHFQDAEAYFKVHTHKGLLDTNPDGVKADEVLEHFVL